MAKTKKPGSLWSEIDENDFDTAENVEDADIGDYNKNGMAIYSINTNLARHIARVNDCLKMVERRILYSMYKINAIPGHQTKSSNIVANTMLIHNHGDTSIYDSMVGMAQYWKKSVPLVYGDCNFGSITSPNSYAADRYTEAALTDYAYECFFEDYNEKAITFDEHLTGKKEPVFLPTKFPNVLVNGTGGIGFGFAPNIPPYNCNDIVDLCTKLIKNPNAEDILIYPDLPTGCDIVNEPNEIKSICETGKGNVRMRGRIDIDGETKPNKWILHIRSIPYTVSYDKMYDAIIDIGKSKKIAIDDVQEHSVPYVLPDGRVVSDIDLQIIISRSLDPKSVRSFLFKNAMLEKTLPVRFTVVKGYKDLVEVNLRELVLAWVDERRLYKRSLFNHQINRLKSEINIRDIMIELLEGKNLDKTMDIIRHTNASDIPEALKNQYGMSSHQAKVVASKPTSAFSKDARERYIQERDKMQKELDKLLKVVYDAKKIDKIILDELEDLRKYATPRKSPIIEIEGESTISDTDHFLVSTTGGRIKKLPYPTSKTKNLFGTFAQGDSPEHLSYVNNLDTVLMIDKTGKYTIMPVHQIPNTLYNDPGEDIYKVAKLDGSIVFMQRLLMNPASKYRDKKKKSTVKKTPSLDFEITFLTKEGFMKKTLLDEFILDSNNNKVTKIRGSRAMKVREDDSLVQAWILPKFDTPAVDRGEYTLIYTEKGEYVLISPDMIPEMGKVSQGICILKPDEGDACKGFGPVLFDEDYLLVVTSKGLVRKESLKYFDVSKKRRDKRYLCNVEDGETIVFASAASDDCVIVVELKSSVMTIPVNDIPVISRRAKGAKMIPVSPGDKIISCGFSTTTEYEINPM